MKKLNILVIGRTPPRLGGSSFQNLEIMLGLNKKGHKIRCITELSKKHLEDPNYDLSWRGSGIEVFPYEMEFIGSAVKPSEKYMREKQEKIFSLLNSLIAQEKPDVIMVGHESFSYYVNSYIRELGIPLVQVLHGTPTHGIDDPSFPEDFREMFLDAMREATLIVGVSRFLTTKLNKYGIYNTTYIYNGADTDMFVPISQRDDSFLQKLGIEAGKKLITHASNLKSIKNPLDIVEAARITAQKNSDFVYVIVGEGDLKQEMVQKVAEYNLEHMFRFVGKVPFDEMPKYYQHSEIFLLPSKNEGFGRVIRECQSCKVVPIVSDAGALVEVTEEGKSGLIFERGNPVDLADKIMTFSNKSEEERIKLKEAAREVAVQTNFDEMINSYERVLFNPLSILLK